MERRSPEEKLKKDFESKATALGKVLVKHYVETSDISPIQQTYVWRGGDNDDWESGGWYLRLSHAELGSVELPMKDLR